MNKKCLFSVLCTICVLMFVSSCSDDDDNTSASNVISTIEVSGQGHEVLTFSYDKSGRYTGFLSTQTKVTEVDYLNSTEISVEEGSTKYKFKLTGNRVVEMTSGSLDESVRVKSTVSYKEDCLDKITPIESIGGKGNSVGYKWENGNIIEISYGDGESSFVNTLEYGVEAPLNSSNLDLFAFSGGPFGISAHALEIVGKRSLRLPTKQTLSYSTGNNKEDIVVTNYLYEYDKQGRIKKITKAETSLQDENRSKTYLYDLIYQE